MPVFDDLLDHSGEFLVIYIHHAWGFKILFRKNGESMAQLADGADAAKDKLEMDFQVSSYLAVSATVLDP
jgi:hypothetical protein